MAGSGNQFYPTCKLIRVDLSHCKLFPQQVDNLLGGSKDSLLCLKFENNIGLSGTHISRAVNNFGKTVQMLTILLPAESDNEMDLKGRIAFHLPQKSYKTHWPSAHRLIIRS